MADIDPGRLWGGDLSKFGYGVADAPIFRRGDITYSPERQYLSSGDAQQMMTEPGFFGLTNGSFGNGSNANMSNWTGNGFDFLIRSGPQTGSQLRYVGQGDYFVPVSQEFVGYQPGNVYGPDFWAGAALAAGLGGAAYGAGAIGGAGAGAGAGEAAAPVAGAGASDAYMGGAAAAGGGGSSAGGGSAAGSSGLFGSGISAGDAVQLGSLAAGALDGNKGGQSGGGSRTPSNPLIPLSQLGGLGSNPASMFGPPQLAGTPPQYSDWRTTPASQLWQQYAGNLFGGGTFQQPQPVPVASQPGGRPQDQVTGRPVRRVIFGG